MKSTNTPTTTATVRGEFKRSRNGSRRARYLWVAVAVLVGAGLPAMAQEGNCDAAESARQDAADAVDRAEVDVSIAEAIGDPQGIADAVQALQDAQDRLSQAEQDVSSLCYAPASDYSTGSGSSGSGSNGGRGSGSGGDNQLDVQRDMCRLGVPGVVNINTCSLCFDVQAGSWRGTFGGWGTGYTCAPDEPQPRCIVEHDEDDGWLQRRLDRSNCEITH